MLDVSHKVTEQDASDKRFQILQAGEVGRQDIQKRRQDWLTSLKLKNKKAVLFELEMLLLGIDRFFYETKYSRDSEEHLLTKDFSKELVILTDSMSKVTRLSLMLLNESDPSFAFRQYVDSRKFSHRLWQQELDQGIEQNTPVDSLYVLMSGFKSYQVLIDSLTQGSKVSFHLFEHLGFLVNRELNYNKHFNPRDFVQFTPFYDKINSNAIQTLIKSIENTTFRKAASVIFLVIFRILNYLKFVPRHCSGTSMLRKAFIVFSLISSEIKNLTQFIEQALNEIKVIKSTETDFDTIKMRMILSLEIMLKRLRNEHYRVYTEELRTFGTLSDGYLRSGTSVEIARSVLMHTCHQTAITFGQVFQERLQGQDIFSDYASPFELSVKLRADLLLFDRLLKAFFETIRHHSSLEKSGEAEPSNTKVSKIFRAILQFTEYFEAEQFPALRLQEYQDFKSFTGRIFEFSEHLRQKNVSKKDVAEFKKMIPEFKAFIGYALVEISKRGELQSADIKPEQIERIYSDYVKQF